MKKERKSTCGGRLLILISLDDPTIYGVNMVCFCFSFHHSTFGGDSCCRCLLHGDTESECLLSEMVGATPLGTLVAAEYHHDGCK
jgi:hypothetical protein